VAGLQCRSLDCVAHTAVTQLSNTVEELTKRLENMETRVLHRISELDSFPPLAFTSAVPVVTSAVLPTNATHVPVTKSKDATSSRSWAEQATKPATAEVKSYVRLLSNEILTRLKLFQED